MKSLLIVKSKFILIVFILNAMFCPAQAQFIQKLKDLKAANSFPYDFTLSGTKLFFIASDDTNLGLWVTDGTLAGTIKLTPSSGPLNSSFDIVSYNNKIYFTYNDGINGYELWVSDGTVAGTTIFKDINPGSTGSFPKNLTVANNKLFFITDIDQKLYVCDGTPGGTTIIKNNGAIIFNGLAQFATLNNDIYFTSDNGTGSGYGLWKSDGTLPGTSLIMANIISTAPGDYAVLNNKLFFSTDDGVHGTELWTTDGTPGGTGLVINLRADGAEIFYGGSPFNMISFNNKVYFTASDDTHGAELFSSDGTAAGTQIVKDILPGTDGSVPQRSVIYNGNLYFSCNGGAATGLWKSDGTAAGTTLIKQGGGNEPFLRDTRFAPVFNGKLYFIVNDQQYYPLWETDGTISGTKLVAFQNTASPANSTPVHGEFSFGLYNGELYLGAICGNISIDIEPCKITSGVLPVTWLTVQAQWINDNEAKVSWTVAEQLNVKNYTVQFSSDGSIFKNGCTVNASSITSYSCNVPADINSKNYYRVMERDVDGKTTYSKIVLLQPSTNHSLVIYPNPAKDRLYIKGEKNFSGGTVSDAGGKVISHFSLSANTQNIDIDISKLAKGIYFIKMISVNDTQTIKFVKE